MKQLAQKGNKIVATCRQPDAVREKLLQLGDVSVTQLDVSSPSSIESWAASVRDITPHVDVVINSAGIYGDRINLDTVTADGMLKVYSTNTIGPLLVVQQLRKQGLLGGNTPSLIANVTSKVGSIDDNGSGGGFAYRASKCALNIVNKSLSIDLAEENVVSTLLHPGYVRTDMTGGKGLIDVETSVAGMLAILEKDPEKLQGTWHDYKNEVIPW